MKKHVILAVSALLVLSSGCSSNNNKGVDPMKTYGCNTLNVYNWGAYTGENTNRNFEKQFNVKINYSLFGSNEEMYTKLLGGSKYDVLVPSDYMVERLMDEKMLQAIDKTAIPNLSNLYEGVMNLPFDPDNTYSAPYLWGSVGIIYNKNKVEKAEVESLGYNILLDSKYKGKAFVYDSERDSFMMALKALGYSMNTENDAEIQAAYEWLLAMDTAIQPSYVTDEVIDGMVNGEKDIAIVYSGDAAYVLSENENMDFFLPSEGTNIWSDAMVIPANAGCPKLANEYINYILSDEVSFDISSTVGYASGNKNILKQMTAEGGDFADNVAYLPRIGYEKDEVFKHNEILKKKLSDLWIKVKNK